MFVSGRVVSIRFQSRKKTLRALEAFPEKDERSSHKAQNRETMMMMILVVMLGRGFKFIRTH